MSYNTKQILLRMLLLIFIVGILLVLSTVSTSHILSPYSIIAISLILWIIAMHMLKRYGNFIVGLNGEGSTSQILRKLPKPYRFLNEVLLDEKPDIDKIVIGPTGVWVIEVKNVGGYVTGESDNVSVGIHQTNYINQTWRETFMVRNRLSQIVSPAHIHPILYFANKNKIYGNTIVKGVHVCTENNLLSLIQTPTADILQNSVIEEIYHLLSPHARKKW